MKKVFSLILISFMLSSVAFAGGKGSVDAVTMVSYEQRYSDYEGTLALKNNTDKEIYYVSFVITYLNMSGTPLDYKEFSRKVRIAPGMTKKLNIPAYERSRNYSYYKSEAELLNPHKFKIKFELKRYNNVKNNKNKVDELNSENLILLDTPSDKSDSDNGFPNNFYYVSIIIILFGIIFAIGLYVLVAVMANNNGRSVVIWLLMSLFFTPLLIIIVLLCIGKSNDYYDNDRFNRNREKEWE